MKTGSAITMRQLGRSELRPAAALLGRAMRDNPAHLRAFGERDTERRRRGLERFFRPVLRGLEQRGLVYGAYRDGVLTGVCGMARPGLCKPRVMEKLRIGFAIVCGATPAAALRVARWSGGWARRDPKAAHWHLGPVAVDPSAQRQGIGSELMNAFCRAMDASRVVAYLETDLQTNVHFYELFGFKVVAEAEVLGVRTWFMSRGGKQTSVPGVQTDRLA